MASISFYFRHLDFARVTVFHLTSAIIEMHLSAVSIKTHTQSLISLIIQMVNQRQGKEKSLPVFFII